MDTIYIQENNKLISEFIGRCGYLKHDLYTFKGVDSLLNGDIWYDLNEAKFHLSWDWLMKVVDKIEGLGYWINRVSGDVWIMNNDNLVVINNPMHNDGIEATYKIVIEFIKWYNKI